VIRRFLRRNKNDRIGLVIFGQQAMLQCPLTHDTKILEKIVADLVIGDVPELGTAIGDGLALAVAQLRRSDAKSKVVILLSDGDSNWVTQFDPDEAARAAAEQHVKVYTILVLEARTSDLSAACRQSGDAAQHCEPHGGEFFRASDYTSFDRGFQTVRNQLDTNKRTITERVPDQQLFLPFALLAAALVFLDFLLAHTRTAEAPMNLLGLHFVNPQLLESAAAVPVVLVLIFLYDRMQRRSLQSRLGELPVLVRVDGIELAAPALDQARRRLPGADAGAHRRRAAADRRQAQGAGARPRSGRRGRCLQVDARR